MIKRFTYLLIILGCVATFVYPRAAQGQTAEVSPAFSDTLLCVNGTLTVPIAMGSTPFHDTNVFRIEMSNATGSFGTPTTIGFAYGNGISATTAYCTLPSTISPGAGYRIRIVTSHPIYISAPNNKNIRVSAPPIINAASNSPICEGGALNLTAGTTSPLPRYDWTGPMGWNANNTQNPSRPVVTTADSGDYVVTVTSYKCTSKDTIKVLVIPKPVFEAPYFITDSFACEGQPFKISPRCNICNLPDSVISFSWTYPPGITTNQSTINLLSSKANNQGWFKVTIQIKGTNCITTDSSFALIKPLPDTPTATNNGPLCVGETLVLHGAANTPGVSYRWEGPNGQMDNAQSLTIPNITKNEEGEWKLYAVKDGCDSKPGLTEVRVGIPLVPLPITGDSLLCPGDRLQLSAQSSTTLGIEWKKLPNDSTIISTNRTFGKNPVTAQDAGLYMVTQEVMGCKSPPSYINIRIPDIKAPAPTNNGPLCIGEKLELTAVTTVNGAYSWTGPDGFASDAQNPWLDDVTEAAEGIYTVTTTLDYCQRTDTTKVTIKPMPEVIMVRSNSPVCDNTYLNLFAESSLGNSTFAWTGPNGFMSADQNPSVFFTNDVSGTYSVHATSDGCVSEPKTTEVIRREGPGATKARSNSPLKEGEKIELFGENNKDSVTFFWTGPDGFTSNELNPIIPVATYRNAGKYELFTIYNGCTTSVFTVVEVKDILGITLELYPNPNDGKFTITGITQTDAPLNLIVYNHQGKVMYRGEAVPDRSKFKTEVDLRGVASGVYILQILQGGENKRIRFTIVQQ